MMSITTELLIIFGLILANGFFAAAEIAILTSRRSRLEQQAHGQAAARPGIALELASNPSRFLPTVQVGMTLVGTLTSVFSGATLVRYLAGGWPRAQRFAGRAPRDARAGRGGPGRHVPLAGLRRAGAEAAGAGQCRRAGPAWWPCPCGRSQIVARPAVWLMEIATGSGAVAASAAGGSRTRPSRSRTSST